jgi:predicted MPP superfamily phosphohydrolase
MGDAVLLLLAMVGHVALWATFYNQVHGRAIPHWLVKLTTIPVYVVVAVVPVLLAWWYIAVGGPLLDPRRTTSLPVLYIGLCNLLGAWAIVYWVVHLRRPPVGKQLSNHTTHYDLAAQLGDTYDGPWLGRTLARVPGNQLLELSVHEKELEIPRLPPELDGLTIAHLTDFHFTGKVGKAWFQEVVRRTNELDADLVALTGDLVDKEKTFPWLGDTLGRLRARHGVYFILGNHDLNVDHRRLREMLRGFGLIDIGSRWQTLRVREGEFVLAGNELPWFAPAADMDAAPPRQANGSPIRIVLAHSPDQLPWARRNDIDLMLAGHTHGGQFRFPIVGPVVTSSLIGSRFAAGTYYCEPTVLHVSRGLSGTVLLRLNCPPELTRLVLRCK